jgi:type VI secretion system secreted protein VgrG
MEVRGEQHGELPPDATARDGALGLPYRCTFECARRGKDGAVAESRFRPARRTPKPRILGSQTAFVTAEPSAQGAEIHVGGPPGGEIGCVRVRFHWDQEGDRLAKEPSSCWVRVSQVFAGVGEGAVWHPRVGVEVVVDFEDGDPDRPLIVGRVYNGQNRPPVVTPTVSTLTSMTSPGDGTYNEFTFDDTAGSQQIRLHTPRDWNSEVGNDRSELVAVNSSSSVGVDRSEATGVNRMAMVGVNNAEVVGENEAVTVGVDQHIAVGQNQSLLVGADQSVSIVKNQSVAVGQNQVVAVTGSQEVHVQGNRGVTVQGNAAELVQGMRVRSVTGDERCAVTGKQEIAVTGQQVTALLDTHVHSVKSHAWITVGGNQLTTVIETEQHRAKQQLFFASSQQLSAEGSQLLESTTFDVEAMEAAAINTKQLLLNGGTQVSVSGGKLVIAMKGDIEIQAANITFKATKISLEGQRFSLNGEDEVEIQGALIKLN